MSLVTLDKEIDTIRKCIARMVGMLKFEQAKKEMYPEQENLENEIKVALTSAQGALEQLLKVTGENEKEEILVTDDDRRPLPFSGIFDMD